MVDYTKRGPEGTYFNPPKLKAGIREYWGDSSVTTDQIRERVVELLDTGSWSSSAKIGSSRDIDPIVRAEMIENIGAPPMRVVSWRTIERLGRIPRSNEGEAVTVPEAMHETYERYKDAPKPFDCYSPEQAPFGGAFPPEWSWPLFDSRTGGMPRVRFVMVSHRWARPSTDNDAHPDFEDNRKAKQLVEYAKKWAEGILQFETYFWIDYSCIDQDEKGNNSHGLNGIYTLPLYISTCTGGMVVLGSEEYEGRAWCRMEQLNFCSFGEMPFFDTLPHPKALGPAAIACGDGHNFKKILQDPRKGKVTVESDMKHIAVLTDIAAKYYGQSWARSSFSPTNLDNYNKLEFGKTQVHMGSNS